MKSTIGWWRSASHCHIGVAIQVVAVGCALTAVAVAQTVPASITTINQPVAGQAVFDAAGNVYYASGGPATPGAAQTQSGGGICFAARGLIGIFPSPCGDAGVVKVDPSGNEVWGTLLGGPTNDSGSALAVDAAGNVFLTGTTGGQFPTTAGAAIPTSTTATVFAARVSANGSKFIYSTYLPATAAYAAAIAVDAQDNAYIAGTSSTGHAYVLKLSADGSSILFNVTLGGSGADAATAITMDAVGNVIVAGSTTSADFPVTNGAYQQHLTGAQNNFVARFDPSGNVLMCTFLGGSGSDRPNVAAVDGEGNIYVAGATSSLDFPTTPGTFEPTAFVPAWNNAAPAGFISQIAPGGNALNWSSYVMSNDMGPDGVEEMALTPAGDIYLGGLTGVGFPVTPSAPQICFQGSANRIDGFVAHLNSQGALVDATYLGPSRATDVNFVWGLEPLAGGAVNVVWHDGGNNVLSKVQFGGGGWTAPACLSTNVTNAATQYGSNGVVAGELITLTGFGIGPKVGVAYQPDSQGNIPLQLAGVQVFFDGAAVPIMYAQSVQINAVAPAALAGKATTSVTVSYSGQQFGPVAAPVSTGSPGIFRLHVGQSAQAAALNQDGTVNSPSNPAARGSIVTIWATGYGLTNPACAIGGLNEPEAEPLGAGVSADIFGSGLYGALYAGSAPGLVCGMVQINFQAPPDAVPPTYFFTPWIGIAQGNGSSGYEAPVGASIAIR